MGSLAARGAGPVGAVFTGLGGVCYCSEMRFVAILLPGHQCVRCAYCRSSYVCVCAHSRGGGYLYRQLTPHPTLPCAHIPPPVHAGPCRMYAEANLLPPSPPPPPSMVTAALGWRVAGRPAPWPAAQAGTHDACARPQVTSPAVLTAPACEGHPRTSPYHGTTGTLKWSGAVSARRPGNDTPVQFAVAVEGARVRSCLRRLGRVGRGNPPCVVHGTASLHCPDDGGVQLPAPLWSRGLGARPSSL